MMLTIAYIFAALLINAYCGFHYYKRLDKDGVFMSMLGNLPPILQFGFLSMWPLIAAIGIHARLEKRLQGWRKK